MKWRRPPLGPSGSGCLVNLGRMKQFTPTGMTDAAQIVPPSTHTRPQLLVRARCQRAASHNCQRLGGSLPTQDHAPVAGLPASVRTRLTGRHETLAADETAR